MRQSQSWKTFLEMLRDIRDAIMPPPKPPIRWGIGDRVYTRYGAQSGIVTAIDHNAQPGLYSQKVFVKWDRPSWEDPQTLARLRDDESYYSDNLRPTAWG